MDISQEISNSTSVPILLLVPRFADEFIVPLIHQIGSNIIASSDQLWNKLSFSLGTRSIVAVSSSKIYGLLGAAEITQALLKEYRPELIILLTFAGTLHNDIKLGDVVIASQV